MLKMHDPIFSSRRDILKFMLGAGLVSVGGFGAMAVPRAEDLANDLIIRTIPSTGERVPALGLGSSGAFKVRSQQDFDRLDDIMKTYLSLGGRFVDTAPSYGDAERVIGEILHRHTDLPDVFMATKIDRPGKQEIIDEISNSESLLHTRPLDLVQIHNLIDVKNHLETLRELKAKGRIRYYGITHFRLSVFDQLESLLKKEKMDFLQLNYSVLTPDAEKRLLPLAADKGVAVIINRAFEDGSLFRLTKGKVLPEWATDYGISSWAQFFLKFVLSHPAVTCVIPATGNKKHLIDNMMAGRGQLPDSGIRNRMHNYMTTL